MISCEKKFNFIDLFAGLGGFHIALSGIGGRCVFAAEWLPHLQDLYHKNYGLLPFGDISLIDPDTVPDHQVLCAGFPCQPFSKAGEQLGFECTKQGQLFFDVAKILRAKKPTFFILENVPNLMRHDGGQTFIKIRDVLGEYGYSIDVAKLSPHQFGIPQVRERLYIVGSTLGLDEFRWPSLHAVDTSIDSVLDSNPRDAKPLSNRVLDCLDVWDDFLSRMPRATNLPSFPLWSMEFGATYPFEEETPYALFVKRGIEGLYEFSGSHGAKLNNLDKNDVWKLLPSHARAEQESFPKWKKDFIRQNRSFYLENKEWIDPWLPKILKFPSSLQKLEWNIKGGERDLWKYVIQFRASGVRVKRPTTAPSLVAMTDTQVPIIAWEKRYMTPNECARLQSLHGIMLPSSSVKAFEALGNAVNAEVVRRIASNLVLGCVN